ncbi:hypothetical protein DP113_10865 [Brasilonema octagenarum UFV-E1]|uniref:Uncharacterized protein n=2 Tax=Brasilonema TaxID=383614 RepID=A0A856MCC3_9CYAN|nr:MULTISPECIES: hypothetical protein [Brasilonema]NMF63345.1 hypothetical protein [Brasilonema octagenarum UFV-OR1]QDL08342.1 hypothetical protein DP114_10925 [Brasilonema sennae CENA114]QDL14697.1 hypothetical protein DP113_10865 [Brasilonema octagenarum UFV-E1]
MVRQRGGRREMPCGGSPRCGNFGVPRHKATGVSAAEPEVLPEGQIEGWFKTAKHRFGLHRFDESALHREVPCAG